VNQNLYLCAGYFAMNTVFLLLSFLLTLTNAQIFGAEGASSFSAIPTLQPLRLLNTSLPLTPLPADSTIFNIPTRTPSPASTPSPISQSRSKVLSRGAIAAIVVASILVTANIVAVFLICLRMSRKKSKNATRPYSAPEISEYGSQVAIVQPSSKT